MSTIIINDKKIEFDGNAIIKVKRDTVSKEKRINTDNPPSMIIEINGNIDKLKCDDANVVVNGNAGSVMTKNGKINCRNINGKVVCMSLRSKRIKGNISTYGDIITERFIGNTNKDYVISGFKAVTSKKDLKKGTFIIHKKYGLGKIVSIWPGHYNYSGSISVKFKNEEYSKTLYLDKVLSNKSVMLADNQDNIIYKEFNDSYEYY